MLTINHLVGARFGPVNLEVDAGECLTVMGPSGAGKTLLLRAIVDLDPNEGEVSWRGQSRNRMPAPQWRDLVGYVPAETGWWGDHVARHFQDPDAAENLVDAVGLPREAMRWEVDRLSTGERHRLGLVRAVSQRPDVLLLDEPTASLDTDATALVEALLRREQDRGVPIVLVTHDAGQVERMASRCVRIENGHLTAIPKHQA